MTPPPLNAPNLARHLILFLLVLLHTPVLSCPFDLISGDVTSTTAIFQASLHDPSCRLHPLALSSNVTVHVSLTPTFSSLFFNEILSIFSFSGIDPRQFPGSFVSRVRLTNLAPSTTYYYRFISQTNFTSPLGSVITLPSPTSPTPLSFLHISCANHNPYPVSAPLLSYLLSHSPSFTLFNGDVVYADRFWLPDNPNFNNVTRCCKTPITTPEYYRSLYSDQRTPQYTGRGFPYLLRSIPTMAIWDDHAVNDNIAGQDGKPLAISELIPSAGTVLPDRVPRHEIEAQYVLGSRSFLENMGVTSAEHLQEMDAVEGLRRAESRVFRKFRAHRDLEVFILDLRQYRDTPVPAVGFLPVLPRGERAEVLCDEEVNGEIAFLCGTFAQPVVNQEGFREANKTMLGEAQKEWLKKGLKESMARCKIVVSSVQILEWYLGPWDRWEGYWQEREEILRWIEGEGIRNVVFLAGDVHAAIYSRVNAGREPAVYEFTTGPVGQATLGSVLGPLTGPVENFLMKYGGNGHLVGEGEERPVKFATLDAPNFMSVEIGGGKLKIRTIGMDGEVVVDQFGNRGEFVLELEEVASEETEANPSAGVAETRASDEEVLEL